MTHVLVVEDRTPDSEALSRVLQSERFEISVASSGAEALARFETSSADIVLLDTALPEMSSNEVCWQLRRTSDVPIIMVGSRDDPVDRVVGLELGADDYLTKPYAPRELVARIRAVLRRRWNRPDAVPTVLEAGPVVMDLGRHLITVNGETTSMPLREFELLEMLLRNTGRVLTRQVLLDRVWGTSYYGDGKTLDVHIRRLRRRVEPNPHEPRHIITVRGLGYRYDP